MDSSVSFALALARSGKSFRTWWAEATFWRASISGSSPRVSRTARRVEQPDLALADMCGK
jgi:hypothetical protein